MGKRPLLHDSMIFYKFCSTQVYTPQRHGNEKQPIFEGHPITGGKYSMMHAQMASIAIMKYDTI